MGQNTVKGVINKAKEEMSGVNIPGLKNKEEKINPIEWNVYNYPPLLRIYHY